MEALATLGVLAATPIVLQFLLAAFLTPAQREALDNRIKMGLSIVLGGVLAVLLALYQDVFPTAGKDMLFLVLNGLIDGAMATGVVNFGFKVVKNLRSAPELMKLDGSTVVRNPSSMIE